MVGRPLGSPAFLDRLAAATRRDPRPRRILRRRYYGDDITVDITVGYYGDRYYGDSLLNTLINANL